MTVELAGLAVANVAYFVVGVAAFAAGGWVSPDKPATWRRLGAAYMVGIVVVVVPASYLALVGLPVGLGAAIAGLVVVALAVGRVGVPRAPARARLRRPSLEHLAALAVTGIGVVVVGYSFRAFVVRPLVDFDAWAIWTAKARLLYEDAGAAPAVLRSGQYGQSPYPLALPTLQALGFGSMGRFDGTLIGAQFAALALGFVGALWSVLERRARPLAIALCAAAVVVAPEILYQLMTHYADVPLGFFVGLGVAAAAAWTTRPDDGWLLACAVAFIGMAALTKSEGTMFAVAAAVALLAAQLGPGWRERARPALVAVGAIALILVPWQLYCAAYHLRSTDYSLADVANVSYLRAHSDRLGPVLRELWKQLIASSHWGYLVLTVAAGILAGALGKRWRATTFAVVWLAVAFGGLVLIYWISTLPTSSNLTNSSFRTIVSLLVGGTAIVPLLIAPTDPEERDS
ncbi:MAG TPA: hypothetical protein VLJ44_03145 [Gaiellaceae bacterium]|nr:hypothetical protein [Gaiellaceae bacterium]